MGIHSLVGAIGDAAAVREFVEERLDQVAPAVVQLVVRGRIAEATLAQGIA